jgi:hypothetical protein
MLGYAPVIDGLIVALALLAIGGLCVAARLGVRRLAAWEAS